MTQLEEYASGMLSPITRITADAGNGLVWCVGDQGKRVKAFRAAGGYGGPLAAAAAGCNRGPDNGMTLQYTLCSDVGPAASQPVGLHVVGTQVLLFKSE